MQHFISRWDNRLIHSFRAISEPLARIALFIVFFWFGILKVIGTSPANPLVEQLMNETLPFLTFSQFIVGFGIFEMVIGLLFIIPRAERVVLPLLAIHMVTTALPLFFLPAVTWGGFFMPTLEGQYIIKNLVIIALAIGVAANLKPMRTLQPTPQAARGEDPFKYNVKPLLDNGESSVQHAVGKSEENGK